MLSCFCPHRGCFLTSSLIGTLALSLTIPLSVLADICMQKVIFALRNHQCVITRAYNFVCMKFQVEKSGVHVFELKMLMLSPEAVTHLLSIGAFLLAVFCRGRSRLPLILHSHALVPLQQLGSRPGGAAESIRFY